MGIRQRREQAGLTQGEIAGKLGISTSQYSRYEAHPDRIRSEMLAKIVRVLGVPSHELLDDSGLMHIIPMASARRIVRVHAIEGVLVTALNSGAVIGEYSPSASVSNEAYAVVAYDDALTNLGAKSIYPGDWCVVDPQEPPKPGDVVHAVDPETDLTVLRIFRPLHPSNPRAPGYILAASTPGFDEIYVPGHIGIQGVVVEKRSLLRR